MLFCLPEKGSFSVAGEHTQLKEQIVTYEKVGCYIQVNTQPIFKLTSDQYYALPILCIFVPQNGHIPCVADLPFFILIAFGSFISFIDLHFTQYACTIRHLLNKLLRTL